MTRLSLDLESFSAVDLKQHGLDRYSADPSTEILMCAYALDDEEPRLWDYTHGPMPPELTEPLADPNVTLHAFNAQFERVMLKRVAKIRTGYKRWRCTMALAYMFSFSGTLEQVGAQVGLPLDQQKSQIGKKLIGKFCRPQRPTKARPLTRATPETDYEDWISFGDYCRQDVVAETSIEKRLRPFPIDPDEWNVYALDQQINDRGFPIDREFMRNGIEMATRRKNELLDAMREITSVSNPNSTQQLLPWLIDRGYPFDDLRKDTVRKVLAEHEEQPRLTDEAVEVLKLRQWAARTSIRKLQSLERGVGADGNMRFCFQYAGAGRTLRWAGRRFQPHNLPRPPKVLEADKKFAAESGLPADHVLVTITDAIRLGDYDALELLLAEPMEGLVGCMRSAIRAPDDERLVIADLSAIETKVTAWTARCTRLLNVFENGLDPYIDFATTLFSVPYDDVSKRQRQDSKPAVLGCTYRLGGGDLRNGKRTGLWGYAESMGVNLTREESHRAVKVFRSAYYEVTEIWYALEKAVRYCVLSGNKVIPAMRINGQRVEVPVEMEMRKPFLIIWLPDGSPRYYHLPRMVTLTMYGFDGEPYDKESFSYFGRNQVTGQWGRIYSHGGKVFENIVQSIARQILKAGLKAAHKEGFNIVAHIHDEIVSRHRFGDNRYTHQLLETKMAQPLHWTSGLPLGAEGQTVQFFRK